MRLTAPIIAILVLGTAGISRGETSHFDKLPAGQPPTGWLATKTGNGQPVWTVEKDSSAPSAPNVLKQSGTAKYPVCLNEDTRLQDGFVEVKFKPVSGKEDQAAGVVWRARNADNYYVCRANALENNVVLYKMAEGKRTSLDIVGRQGGYGVKAPVPAGQWHSLRVDFQGTRFLVVLDGTKLFEVEDATFGGPGMAGVWTKADSVTLFDDFNCGNNAAVRQPRGGSQDR